MKRNPYFKEWSKAAQPGGYADEIVESFGLTVDSQITEIERRASRLDVRVDPAGPAHGDRDEVREPGAHLSVDGARFAPLNANVAPFNNAKARRAAQLAVDRSAAVKIFGGSSFLSPSCQVLPPGRPGAPRLLSVHEASVGKGWSAPDLARARALVKASGTPGPKVTVVTADDDVNKSIGVYLQTVLDDIGYKAEAKRSRPTSSTRTRRIRRTKSRSACSSSTRTIRSFGLPPRPVRLRVVPSRQRREPQHVRLLRPDDQRAHAQGACSGGDRPAAARMRCGPGSTGW